jgi:hypothetical protein
LRELYWITIKYDHPVAGTVQIFAENDEQAREIVSKAHTGMKNFEIVDCHTLTAEQKAQVLGDQMRQAEQMQFDFEGDETKVDKEKLN